MAKWKRPEVKTKVNERKRTANDASVTKRQQTKMHERTRQKTKEHDLFVFLEFPGGDIEKPERI